jgi:hypothetical protein
MLRPSVVVGAPAVVDVVDVVVDVVIAFGFVVVVLLL